MSAVNPQTDIDAIEARADAATPGPWQEEQIYDSLYGVERPGPRPKDTLNYEWGDLTAVYEDAVFIAAARTDVPALCAEVRQLRQALAAVEKLAGHAASLPLDFKSVCDLADRIVAALGAAGSQGQSGENPKDTPTPQDEKRAFCDWRCTDAPHTHPVTSTPEAATEAECSPDGCPPDGNCCLDPPARSGLQRATEQKADYFDFAEMRAGSDTPADQPERDVLCQVCRSDGSTGENCHCDKLTSPQGAADQGEKP